MNKYLKVKTLYYITTVSSHQSSDIRLLSNGLKFRVKMTNDQYVKSVQRAGERWSQKSRHITPISEDGMS